MDWGFSFLLAVLMAWILAYFHNNVILFLITIWIFYFLFKPIENHFEKKDLDNYEKQRQKTKQAMQDWKENYAKQKRGF